MHSDILLKLQTIFNYVNVYFHEVNIVVLELVLHSIKPGKIITKDTREFFVSVGNC